jgi:hypothetical protein
MPCQKRILLPNSDQFPELAADLPVLPVIHVEADQHITPTQSANQLRMCDSDAGRRNGSQARAEADEDFRLQGSLRNHHR